MQNVEERPEVYNGHFEVDILIDRPASRIWPHFLKTSSWVMSHDVELVKGTLGSEGAITRLWWKEAVRQNLPSARYHYCKVIKAVPDRQLILKTYSEAGGSYGMEIVAFDDTRLIPAGAGTRVVFTFFVEIKSEAVALNPDNFNLDASREGMLTNLDRLKRLVERA